VKHPRCGRILARDHEKPKSPELVSALQTAIHAQLSEASSVAGLFRGVATPVADPVCGKEKGKPVA